ncbi:MAG: hypothetical protein ACFFD4_13735 [Candidatus Odinarchaeota archaeon]
MDFYKFILITGLSFRGKAMDPVSPMKYSNSWDYTRFQREILSLLSSAFQHIDIARKVDEKTLDFQEIMINIDEVHSLFNRFRPALEQEFCSITDSQFFTAVFGQGMGYGESREVYYYCFREYESLVTSIGILSNYHYFWESPPDIFSSIGMGGHYLVICELIQLGRLIIDKFASKFLEQESHVKEFFFRLLNRDPQLEHVLRDYGIINRWFKKTRQSYLVLPFDAVLPPSNLPSNEREVLFAVWVAFLLTKGMGVPINFYKNVYKGFYFLNNQELFKRLLADTVFEKFKILAFKQDIQNLLYSNYNALWSFKPPENLISPVFSYVKAKFGDIDELVSLIDTTTRGCLKKLDAPEPDELKKALMSSVASVKSILKYLRPPVSREQVEVVLEKYFSIINQILEIVRKEQYEYAKITQERMREERKKNLPFIITEKLDDLNQKLDLIPLLFGHPYRKLSKERIPSNFLSENEYSLIVKGSTYLAYDTLAHLPESSKEWIQEFLFNYLLQEIDQIKGLDRDYNLQNFINAEIKLLSEILTIEEIYLGSLSNLWQNFNPTRETSGIITSELAKLLLKWILLPKERLIDKNPVLKTDDFVNISRRNDLRNLLAIISAKYQKSGDNISVWDELERRFPNQIIPSRTTLFADAFMVKGLIKDMMLD